MSALTRAMSFSLILVAELVIPAPVSAQSAKGKLKSTGSISGCVTLNDKGAPGITVAALGNDMSNRQTSARNVTDSEGNYRLTNLPAGQYQVTALAPGFSIRDQNANANSYYGPGKSIVLSVGESVADVNIGLVRGSVITGRITDADGKPVVEQTVNLQLIDQRGNTTPPSVSMWNYQMNQTDDRGVYRIYGLPAGRYRLSVGTDRNAGFINSNNHSYYPLTFYPDVNDPARATIIELTEGTEAANIDIRVGHAANTYVATGRIIDAETGQPLLGIPIMYGPWLPNQPSFAGSIGGIPTNKRGEFRIEGLEPGRYGVGTSQFESSSVYSDPILFEIVDADITNLEIRASRGLTLSGVVVFDGASSKELLSQLTALRIFATSASSSNSQSRTQGSSTIAADGGFQISGLRPGRVHLNVYAISNPILRGIATTRIERGGVDVTQNLELQPGESIVDLRIVAELGTGIIRGTVKFEGGEAPANPRLFVNARREGGNSGGSATVDARGHFLISNLAAGTYSITLNGTLDEATGRGIGLTQVTNVTDDAETEVMFTVDLKRKPGGAP